MALRQLFILAIVLVALSVAWGKRHALDGWFATPDYQTKSIEFDNGTVRASRSASDASATSEQSRLPAGAMRKCQKGGQISYTDVTCPPGFKEMDVGGPPVNVLPAQASVAKPAEGPSLGKTRSSLHDALDLSRDDKLKDRIMERAIEGKK